VLPQWHHHPMSEVQAALPLSWFKFPPTFFPRIFLAEADPVEILWKACTNVAIALRRAYRYGVGYPKHKQQ